MAQPQLNSIHSAADSVEQFGKFEIDLDVLAFYSNPYDYDQIEIWAEFTGPGNVRVKVDGFFMQDFDLNADGSLVPGNSCFSIRFSPTLVGTWPYRVFARDKDGATSSPPFAMMCGPQTSPENHGFLRSNQTNYLSFDDGKSLVLIGENICWPNQNAYLDYKKWLGKLSAEGGNYFRLWHAHWGLGIEWKSNVNGFEGLRSYKEENSRYQDWLFDYAAEKGLYIMLALQHHGPVSTQVNPNWDESPYNAANGGPCANTWDFFTDPAAIAHTKNRFRYIVARWGYARSIMAWELFSEVDWTDNYASYQTEIADWHAEMAAYLKQIDPYKHLVTTSFAKEAHDPMVWANPDLDFTQTHHYINTPQLEWPIVNSIRAYLDAYDKPTMNGEFGLGPSNTLADVDPDGIHIHNSLWASLFSGGMGTAMTWWWDVCIESQNLYYHFGGVAAVARKVPFMAANMQPVPAAILKAPGDLRLIPALGWEGVGLDSFFIDQDGSLSPANPGGELSTYLYGLRWNTAYRSPPVFTVYYPQAGTFTVRTGSGAGRGPKITLTLNGNQVLNQSASTNTAYSINVNAGLNVIQIDNTGRDWISVASYSFSGLGSKVDAYVLASADQPIAAGWVLNTDYTHETMRNIGVPGPVVGAKLRLTGLVDSSYFVKWFDCLTGGIVAVVPVEVVDGLLETEIPPLAWDLSFLVDYQDDTLSQIVERLEFSLQIYPNPSVVGGTVQVSLGETVQDGTLSLLDISGRSLLQQPISGMRSQFTLPQHLASGYYWVKVRTPDRVGARPLLVR